MRTPESIREEQSAELLLETELGLRLRGVRMLPEGYSREMYTAELGGEEVFIRVDYQRRGIATDLAILDLYGAYGVPAPELLGENHLIEGLGVGAYALRRASGAQVRTFPRAKKLELLARAGEVLHRMHSIPMEGYGAVHYLAGALRGSKPSWADYMHSREQDLEPEPLLLGGFITGEEATRITAAFARAAAQSVPAALLHRDFHSSHVFTDGEQITAVIDFEKSVAGDPRFDLAVSAYHQDDEQRAAFAEGYGGIASDPLIDDYLLTVAARKLSWAQSSGLTSVVENEALPKLARILRG